MKVTKLTKGNYQRNGVAGEGFFSAIMEWKEDGEKKHHKNFLTTFQTYPDNTVDWETCRVIDLDNLQKSWRGDNFANDLSRFFTQNKITDIYKYIKEV